MAYWMKRKKEQSMLEYLVTLATFFAVMKMISMIMKVIFSWRRHKHSPKKAM